MWVRLGYQPGFEVGHVSDGQAYTSIRLELRESLTLQTDIHIPMQETVPEFQVDNCALFSVRVEVVRGTDELNCVGLHSGMPKPYVTVSRLVRMEFQASRDSTEEDEKGRQLEFGDNAFVLHLGEGSTRKPKLPLSCFTLDAPQR